MIWRKLSTTPISITKMIRLLMNGLAQKKIRIWLNRMAATSATSTRKITILIR